MKIKALLVGLFLFSVKSAIAGPFQCTGTSSGSGGCWSGVVEEVLINSVGNAIILLKDGTAYAHAWFPTNDDKGKTRLSTILTAKSIGTQVAIRFITRPSNHTNSTGGCAESSEIQPGGAFWGWYCDEIEYIQVK